jgi:hypothetical protein
MCGGSCADTNTNPLHCGSCDSPCSEAESCTNGVCGTCSETSANADSAILPADIIVVVDNSGSMTDEATFVQDSMVDFVTAITMSGIDAHVILISSDSNDDQGICVPAPVGSGSCPNDENLPNFRHVVQEVGSSNSLQLITSTYNQWSSSLRPDATKSIVVISDDDSGITSGAFDAALLAMDPTFAGYKFDAIVAPYDLSGAVCFPCVTSGNCMSCDPCCGLDTQLGIACTALPADEGTVYKELVTNTGGVLGNLCTQDFLPVFQDVATAVVTASQVPCIYSIPEPPNNEMIDLGKVNVDYTLTALGVPTTIPNVADQSACTASGGWYYNPPTNPTQVVLCQATCEIVQSSDEAEVAVKFGCSTIVE